MNPSAHWIRIFRRAAVIRICFQVSLTVALATTGLAQGIRDVATGEGQTDGGAQNGDKASEPVVGSLPNLKVPTLGGKQLWTDHAWRRGWKLQQHALTGHWRLIDPSRIRHAWGSQAACRRVLDAEVPDRSLPTRHVIVLLHGLMRSSTSMNLLAKHLESELECTTACFEYASTRGSITEHTAAFRAMIEDLPEDCDLQFVGHSMGNIIVRHAIGDWQRAGDQATLDRIKSLVMLGPPNQGASIARQLARTGLFGWVAGKGGMELGPDWEQFESKLAIPHCPFGIVAGRLDEDIPLNPLVGAAGDFVVSVEETKLPGAADFLEVPKLHSFLMDDPKVQASVASFLRTGQFPH